MEEVKEEKLSSEQKEIKKEVEAEARHRANAEEFRNQFQDLEVSLANFDNQTSEEVDHVLEGLPDMSAKGLADKILKISNPKRTHLVESISKLKMAAENSLRKANQCRGRIKQLEKRIDNIRFSSQAFDVFETLGKLIELLKSCEACLDDLKPFVLACEEPTYFQRALKAGFPKSYEVICDSFLKPQNLQHLGLGELLERIGNLGTSYGPALLDKQTTHQADVPLVRDGSVTPTWMKPDKEVVLGYYNEKGEYVLSEDPGWIKRATRPPKPEKKEKTYSQQREALRKLIEKKEKKDGI